METLSESAQATDLQAQLRAAQRTIAVLKHRMLALQDGGGRSVIDRQLERSRRRLEEHDRRRQMMEVRAQELEAHKCRLEGEVAERTRSIRTIVDNVQFGFFLVDKTGLIDDGATRSCSGLFGRDIRDVPFVDVIARDPTTAAHITLALEQVFDDVLPEDVSLGLLPTEVSRGGCVLSLAGRLVRSDDGTPERILFSVADVTALYASRQDAARNKALVQILSQRGAFRAFLTDAQGLLIDGHAAVARRDEPALRRIVHTLKGNAASFGLSEVVDAAHAVEDGSVIDDDDLDSIADALRGFMRTYGQVLDMDYEEHDDDAAIVLAGDVKQRFFAAASAVGAPKELRELANELRLSSAADFLSPLHSLVERLGERLGKSVVLCVKGMDTRIDTKRYGGVVASLGHLIRNAVDHGIEPAAERGDKGPSGHIDVDVSADARGWTIRISDDGRGLNRAAIAARARELCVYCKEEEPTDEELLALIAADGLSTADLTTDVSGRGIGVAAVVNAIRDAGGDVHLTTRAGRGTTFVIALPR
jgi:two-component system chemotaxis sensor kinase CheA